MVHDNLGEGSFIYGCLKIYPSPSVQSHQFLAVPMKQSSSKSLLAFFGLNCIFSAIYFGLSLDILVSNDNKYTKLRQCHFILNVKLAMGQLIFWMISIRLSQRNLILPFYDYRLAKLELDSLIFFISKSFISPQFALKLLQLSKSSRFYLLFL